MSTKKENEKVVLARLDKDLEEKFKAIASFLAIKSESETIRYLIQDFYRQHETEIKKFLPRFTLFNCDKYGCKIHDREMGVYAQIHFKPEGIIICEECKTTNCPHIQFALEQSRVQKIIKNKKLTDGNFQTSNPNIVNK